MSAPKDPDLPGLREPPAEVEARIDWREAERFLRESMRRRLPYERRPDIDDLVQEALLRLLRLSRREPLRKPEAVMNDLARKTAIDFQRRRCRWKEMFVELDGSGLEPIDRLAEANLGDPVTRLRFTVLEFFGSRAPLCRDLAFLFFQGLRSWSDAASRFGKKPEAVRQQWARCIKILRKQARAGGGALAAWAVRGTI